MLEFIKMFGLGILYTLLLPFIVASFAVFVIYAIFNYLVLECVNLFGFFFGYTFTTETDLERKLDRMRESSDNEMSSRILDEDGVKLKGSETNE